MQQAHLPKIHGLIDECFRGTGLGFEQWDYQRFESSARDTDLWVAAWDGDDVVGLVTNQREQAHGHVDSPWVAVRPSYRRQGLAGVLLRHSLAILREHGFRLATITTVAQNVNDSVGLYQQAGYKIVREMPRWRKPLGGP